MATRARKRSTATRRAHPTAPRLVLEVSRLQLAALLGTHEDRVTKYTARGMPVVRKGGTGEASVYDAVACLAWWRAQQDVTPAGGANLVGARASLARVQTERGELELRKRRGDVLERADVEREWIGIVVAARARLLALPSAVADRLVTAAAADGVAGVQRLLQAELTSALEELSRTGQPAGVAS